MLGNRWKASSAIILKYHQTCSNTITIAIYNYYHLHTILTINILDMWHSWPHSWTNINHFSFTIIKRYQLSVTTWMCILRSWLLTMLLWVSFAHLKVSFTRVLLQKTHPNCTSEYRSIMNHWLTIHWPSTTHQPSSAIINPSAVINHYQPSSTYQTLSTIIYPSTIINHHQTPVTSHHWPSLHLAFCHRCSPPWSRPQRALSWRSFHCWTQWVNDDRCVVVSTLHDSWW